MRKLLFFWISLCCTGKTFSQNLDLAWHGLTDKPKQLVSINSKCFYIDENWVSVIGLAGNGQVIFGTSLPGVSRNSLQRLLRTKDHCLAVIGTGLHCDVLSSPINRNFIVKTDTNGVIKFQTIVQPYVDQFVDLTQHPDSSYYIVSDSLLYHYSKNGAFISKINTGLTGIKSAIFLINGNLLISGKINSVLKNVEITTTSGIINQQITNTQIAKFIQTASGKIFRLTTSNIIQLFAPNLTLVNSSPNTITLNHKVLDFTTKNDSLLITGTNTLSNSPFFIISDGNFNVLYQTPVSTYKNIVPSGIAISNNNKVNIISKSTSSSPASLSFTSYYQFPVNGNFISKHDIGVTSFSVIGKPEYNTSSPPTISCNLDVTVKNFTNDTIKNFYLNYDGFAWCIQVNLHKYYDTIILPNSTVNVKTGSFYVEISSNRPDLCIYTTVPDSSNDIQIDNDAFCKSMSIVLDINKTGELDETLKIFPNPFKNFLNIESYFEIIKIEIYNASGHMIKESIVKNKTFSFDHSDLANGIYLLKLATENGTKIKKIVKQ